MLKKLVNFLKKPSDGAIIFEDSGVLPYLVLRSLMNSGADSRGVILCQRLSDAERLAGELAEIQKFTGYDVTVELLPEVRTTRRGICPETEAERLRVLDGFVQGKFRWLIAGSEAMLAHAMPPSALFAGEIIFSPGGNYPFEEIISQGEEKGKLGTFTKFPSTCIFRNLSSFNNGNICSKEENG
jgi:hypothetical protein